MSVDTWLGIVGIVLGVAGIVLALLLYFFDLKKKLEQLLAKMNEIVKGNEGVLTKEQAYDLIDLYLDAVESHIELSLRRYASNDLEKHYQAENFVAIGNEFSRTYDRIVIKSIRKMVSSFLLRGNHRVDHLIGSISQDTVQSTMKSVLEMVQAARDRGEHLDNVTPQLLKEIRDTNATGKKLLKEAIDRYYPPVL